MTNRVRLTAVAWCFASALFAQQPQVPVTQEPTETEEENSDFTFSESQLDEDNDASQSVSALMATIADPYLSQVGYSFSPMRF